MPKFNDPNKLAAHIKKAMDALQAEVLITVQSRISSTAVSPYDTGRFRSSWMAAEGSPSSDVAPEGANSPNTDATSLKVDSRREYHLTNNLPYAQAISLEGKVVSQPANWFHNFRDQTIPKIQQTAAEQIRREFDL